MSQVTLYHNPRCSKSRETCQLLRDNGIEPLVREYLKDVPSADELRDVLSALGISARELLRTKEAEYKELGLADTSLSDDQIIAAMVQCPKLIERPIAIRDGKARIGRPPESVLEIL
ncbi:arsenate reductase (glutaredoxin) [Marinobacterium aestuarii]|uniref:Arsenate reductase n=1 Tax=Marinobacterium aestuarii TaxID=1821621 RepID=A0A1A9F0R2_9GAMM|nr:arsenate reductase (glutaredoxin) [Marinobacterium aestuarii]ANG63333.1 arsenate reductase (glutaredoxin) [Marinobacterium aestuarii]